MLALLLVPIMSLLSPVYSKAGCTKTVNFDSIPTGAPPSPYAGLTYTGFTVSKEQDYLVPASGSQYLEALNSFQGSIHFANGPKGSNAIGFYIRSLSFGCVSGPQENLVYPTACDLSLISEYPSAQISINHQTLSFNKVNTTAPTKVQSFALVNTSDPNAIGFGGQSVYFSLSGGSSVAEYFIDNLVYEFFPCN